MIKEFIGRLLKLVPAEPVGLTGTFNVSALPISPVDGMTVDKLNRIIKQSYLGSSDDLFGVYSHIMMSDTTWIAGSLQRKGPLVARPTSVTTPAKADAATIFRRDFCREQWRQCKGKRVALSHLLDAHAWPVSLVRKIYQPAKPGSAHFYDLTELRLVPFWHLTFAADVSGPAGVLKVKLFRPDGTWSGKTELPDPMHYVIHRGHLLQSMPDCWGGPMRAVVFWVYFATWARQAAANHLEAHNSPKWIAKYPKVDAITAKKELLRAFARSVNTTALVVPEDAKIEAVTTLQGETATAFMEFIKLCQREIAKVAIVQTLTMEAQAQGLGSGQSNVQSDALDGIREFDSSLLAETVEEQIFRPVLELNAIPGGITPSLSWSADDDDAQVKADMLNDLKLAGIQVKEEGMEKLSGIIGLPLERVPEPGAAMPGRFHAFAAEEARRGRLPTPVVDAHAALDRLAEDTAADLADAFGADFAGLSRAIREATGPADLLRRVQPMVAGFEPHRSARILEDVLSAAAGNGFMCAHHSSEA